METNPKLIVVAVVCALAALAAGAFAWQRGWAYAEASRDLAAANRELGSVRSDLAKTRAELERLQKEAVEQKIALEQMRVEVGQARSFIEAEKATGVRLRAELAEAKDELAKKDKPKPPARR